eukprot:1141674-Pelagomonas_calceolata.AAC.7
MHTHIRTHISGRQLAISTNAPFFDPIAFQRAIYQVKFASFLLSVNEISAPGSTSDPVNATSISATGTSLTSAFQASWQSTCEQVRMRKRCLFMGRNKLHARDSCGVSSPRNISAL